MKTKSSTDKFIEDLLDATFEHHPDTRQKYVLREALLGLVRLAKAEQVFEMRTTVDRLTGNECSVALRQKMKSRQQRNQVQSGRWPQQMEFNQFE